MLLRTAAFVGLFLTLTLTWLIYRPGLAGPFLFDDYANLPTLGEGGPVTDSASFVRYITSGAADPTGRPVAIGTFLLDARDWPTSPYPFKRTNLILHLINGALLFLILTFLGIRALPRANAWRTRAAALMATSCWLVHPLFVSTTLYVVQREAMLAATFTELGLLGWLVGRSRLSRGENLSGLTITLVSICFGTLLGLLSKANGILLPTLILLLEYTLLRRRDPVLDTAGHRYYRRVLVGLCIPATVLVIAGLLTAGIYGVVHGVPSQRPWTLIDRLLTEPRVLWQYLRLLWLPTPFSAGVFNDQFPVSTSPLTPWITLPACLGLVGLVAVAWRVRFTHPLISAAIGFFLVGHAIESTTIPLELYFEHRNYLPAMLMFWPLSIWLTGASAQPSVQFNVSPVIRISIGLMLVSGLSWMTHANAQLWGNSRDQAKLWAILNPASPRAQVNAAQDEISRGNSAQALDRLLPLFMQHPDELQLSLNIITARCALGTLTDADLESARVAMLTTRDPGTLLASWFARSINEQNESNCPALGLSELDSLLQAGAHNRRFPKGRVQDIFYLRGLIALRRQQPDAALMAFNQALSLDPRPGLALRQAAALGADGYPAQGLEHLSAYDRMPPNASPSLGMPALHAWILDNQGYWTHERSRLENTLRNDLRSEQARS